MADVVEKIAAAALERTEEAIGVATGAPGRVTARSAARLAPVGIHVSQRDAASAFANCGHTVAYVVDAKCHKMG